MKRFIIAIRKHDAEMFVQAMDKRRATLTNDKDHAQVFTKAEAERVIKQLANATMVQA